METKVTYSKTAQVVLVENNVAPEALCVSLKSPYDLGSVCLPCQTDRLGSSTCDMADADSVPKKIVGSIFKAAPTIRPRPATMLKQTPFTSLPAIADDDDDDATMLTGGSTGSDLSATTEPIAKTSAAEATARGDQC